MKKMKWLFLGMILSTGQVWAETYECSYRIGDSPAQKETFDSSIGIYHICKRKIVEAYPTVKPNTLVKCEIQDGDKVEPYYGNYSGCIERLDFVEEGMRDDRFGQYGLAIWLVDINKRATISVRQLSE